MESKSGFDSRTILVIIVCMGIWLGWQQYLEKKYPEPVAPPVEKSTTVTDAAPLTGKPTKERSFTQPAAHAAISEESENLSNIPETPWTYEDSNWKVTISNKGGRVSEISLKKYTDRDGKPIVLVSSKEPGYLLTSVRGSIDPKLSALNYTIKELAKDTVQLRATRDGVNITKTLKIVPEDYIIKDQTTIDGKTSGIQNVVVQVSQPEPKEGQSSGSFLNRGAGGDIQEYFFNHGTKTNRHLTTAKDPIGKTYDQTHFASLGSRYFTTLLFNRGNVVPTGEAAHRESYSFLEMNYPVLDQNSPISLNVELYAGPKVLNQLKRVDEQAAQVVDFGFFSWIALPLLEVMKYFYKIFNNYGVAIIALTILVRAITFPFTYMSFKSMRAMQKIQPELKRLKEIYKDNTQQLNQETMKLMRDNKVNPAGGCLPLLLQLPVFWALYQVLQNSIELYHSPFILWIQDLSMKDPYYILPVLMGLSMLIQQKITPNTMDPAQAKVMMFMPLFFAFLMMSLPAGLTLYIFVSTIFGVIQQVYMVREPAGGASPALVRRT